MDLPPKPPASTTDPRTLAKQPGRSNNEHGQVGADEQAADTVRARKTA